MIRERKRRLLGLLSRQCDARLDQLGRRMAHVNQRADRLEGRLGSERAVLLVEHEQARQRLAGGNDINIAIYRVSDDARMLRSASIERLSRIAGDVSQRADSIRAEIATQKARGRKLDELQASLGAENERIEASAEDILSQEIWSAGRSGR